MLLPKDSKDVPALRTFLTALRTQTCAASDAFSEPLAALAGELTTKLDTFIGDLPKEEACGDWSLESKLETLFALLANASAMASMAGLELRRLKAARETQPQVAAAPIALPAAPAALITGETPAPLSEATPTIMIETITQETVTQLCADARKLGVAEGEQNVRTAMAAEEAARALVATRKQALQTAGLPLPETAFEEVLSGSPEAFTALQTQYHARLGDLQKQGIQLASSPLLPKLYLPEAQYALFAQVVSGIAALKTPPVEVLAAGPATVSAERPMIV